MQVPQCFLVSAERLRPQIDRAKTAGRYITEDAILKYLRREFPDHMILGEEGGYVGNPDSDFVSSPLSRRRPTRTDPPVLPPSSPVLSPPVVVH